MPVVLPSNTPDRISTRSSSCRCVTWRDVPGLRRSSSGWMSASDSVIPGGQPSTTQPIAGPWLSPKDVTVKSLPSVLPDMGKTRINSSASLTYAPCGPSRDEREKTIGEARKNSGGRCAARVAEKSSRAGEQQDRESAFATAEPLAARGALHVGQESEGVVSAPIVFREARSPTPRQNPSRPFPLRRARLCSSSLTGPCGSTAGRR